MQKLVLVCFVWLTALSGVSCREKVAQIAVEQRIGVRLAYLLGVYEAQHPGLELTNISQLYANAGAGYPFDEDKSFRSFGKHAGFTHSIYEKYVFTSPNKKLKSAEGEVLLLNAQPFPNREDRLGRMVISKAAPGVDGYRLAWYSENQIQRIFQSAGMVIPKPVVLPPPPPKPPIDDTSRKAAEALLEESYRLHPVPLWQRPAWQAAGLIVVFCAILYGVFRLTRRP